MAERKQPQDRKPKQRNMFEITADGVSVKIGKDAIDDFELLDDLAEMQQGNNMRIVSAFKRLFGDDYARVIAELKGEDRRLPIEKAVGFFMKVFKEIDPNS